MINRTRMLLDDLDSEGFPVAKPRDALPLAALNLGRTADHQMVQALLADHKCLNCEPELGNPWPTVDYTLIEARIVAHMVEDVSPAAHAADLAYRRDLVRAADQRMDGVSPTGRLANAQVDGIKQLSDRAAPDAYFGWK